MSDVIQFVTTFLYLTIFARVILSWFPQIQRNNPLVQLIYTVTEPILAPIRRFVPRFGMMDLSPMIALILILVVQSILLGLF